MRGLPSLTCLVKAYGRTANRTLGQNFIADERILKRIAGCIATHSMNRETHLIVEIGPGPGGLTRELLNLQLGDILAVEKDKGFRAALEPLVERHPERISLSFTDALEMLELSVVKPQVVQKLSLVGNLPFGISSTILLRLVRAAFSENKGVGPPLLCGIIQQAQDVEMVLMFQKEVGQRIAAAPGTAMRSKLSALVQQFFDVQHQFFVPRTAFFPQPEVDAAVIRLVKRRLPQGSVPYDEIEHFLSPIFAHPRKKVLNNIRSLKLGGGVPSFLNSDLRPSQLDNEIILQFYHWYRELRAGYSRP